MLTRAILSYKILKQLEKNFSQHLKDFKCSEEVSIFHNILVATVLDKKIAVYRIRRTEQLEELTRE